MLCQPTNTNAKSAGRNSRRQRRSANTKGASHGVLNVPAATCSRTCRDFSRLHPRRAEYHKVALCNGIEEAEKTPSCFLPSRIVDFLNDGLKQFLAGTSVG